MPANIEVKKGRGPYEQLTGSRYGTTGRVSLGGEKFEHSTRKLFQPDPEVHVVIVETKYLKRTSGRSFDTPPLQTRSVDVPKEGRVKVRLGKRNTLYLRQRPEKR